jgi:hypothetical protein
MKSKLFGNIFRPNRNEPSAKALISAGLGNSSDIVARLGVQGGDVGQ